MNFFRSRLSAICNCFEG